MMISTRGRYALRVLIDLAEHTDCGFIPMKEIAERQGISLKYIGGIMPVLTKNKLVEGIHGKGGGYRKCHYYSVVVCAVYKTALRFSSVDYHSVGSFLGFDAQSRQGGEGGFNSVAFFYS